MYRVKILRNILYSASAFFVLIYPTPTSTLPSAESSNQDPCDDDRLNKDYLYSKESAFDGNDHLFWGPGAKDVAAPTHLQLWEAAPSSSRALMFLRNVQILDEGPVYGASQLQALRFTGEQSSYATVRRATGEQAEDVQADENFTWYMEILPNSTGSGQGVLLEYSNCFNPLRIEQVDMVHIRVTAGDNLHNFHTLQANNVLSPGSWTRLAFTYEVDEVYLKIIVFPNSGEEQETLLPICSVDRSRRLNATGDVRIGASYSTEYSPFDGWLGCVQFFRGYLLKSYDAVPQYCDPALSRNEDLSLKEYTKDEDPNDLIAARECSSEVTTESPTTEVPTTQMTTNEMQTTEMPTKQATTNEMQTTEVPTTQMTTNEMPTTEMPTSPATTNEMQTTEMSTTQATTNEMQTTEVPTTQMTNEMQTTEVPTTQMTANEMPTTQMTTNEMPTTQANRMPTTEMQTTQTTTNEMQTTEMPTTQATTNEMQTTEMPTTQANRMPTTEMLTTQANRMLTTQMPTTQATTNEMQTTEMPTTQAITDEMQTTEVQGTNNPRTEEPTTHLVQTATPTSQTQWEDRCASFRLAQSQVDLDPTLPLLATEHASTVGGCAQICFATPSCSAIGFGGTSCFLTTAADFSARYTPLTASGFYDFFTMD